MKILIDSNFLAYRAFYTTGDLSFREQKTGVIFTFLMQVLKLANLFKTNDFIFCWDSKKSFRKVIYPTYKSNRRKEQTETEKIKYSQAYFQFDLLKKEILSQLGFSNVFSFTGYEADDIIATICQKCNTEFIIVSSDNDLYQLLTPKIKMFNPAKKEYFTYDDFIKAYGIYPSQWTYVKSIAGCNTDGVKGIKGIADPGKNQKSKVFAYLKGELKGKLLSVINSINGQKIISDNLKLIKLPFDNGVDLDLHIAINLKKNSFDKQKFIEVFSKYDFKSQLNDLDKWKIFFNDF